MLGGWSRAGNEVRTKAYEAKSLGWSLDRKWLEECDGHSQQQGRSEEPPTMKPDSGLPKHKDRYQRQSMAHFEGGQLLEIELQKFKQNDYTKFQ